MAKAFRKNLPFIFSDDELIKPGIAVNSEKIEELVNEMNTDCDSADVYDNINYNDEEEI